MIKSQPLFSLSTLGEMLTVRCIWMGDDFLEASHPLRSYLGAFGMVACLPAPHQQGPGARPGCCARRPRP